jgi:hypothetical protein
MVVASGSLARSRQDKGIEKLLRYLIDIHDALVLMKKSVQEPQRRFLCAIAAAKGSFVRKKPLDTIGESTLKTVDWHHTIASPSPEATSRSASTATFAWISVEEGTR